MALSRISSWRPGVRRLASVSLENSMPLTLEQVRASLSQLPVRATSRPPLLHRSIEVDERLPFFLNSTEPQLQSYLTTAPASDQFSSLRPASSPSSSPASSSLAPGSLGRDATVARTIWEATGYNYTVLFGQFSSVKMRLNFATVFNPFSGCVELTPHPSAHLLQHDARKRVLQEALIGTMSTKLQNAINGCLYRYKRLLRLVGMGYRIASVSPHPTHANQRVVEFQLGRSHLVPFALPSSVHIQVLTKRGTVFRLLSTDLEAMQRVAMGIRQLKPPEPYTGKGVVFWGETVLRKEGKKK